MKETFDKIVGSRFGLNIDKFCNSIWYVAAIGVVCIISHTFDIVIVGAALLTILLVSALLFCKNSFTLAPFLMMCSFVMSKETMPQSGYYNSPSKIVPLCILLVFIVAALVFNLIYYGKWKLIFKKSYLTASICLASGALIIGGVGSPTFSFNGVVTALTVAIAMFLPYSLLINCGEYKGKKTIEYFAYAAMAAAVVIGCAIFKQLVVNDFDMSLHKTTMSFGFAGPNTSAAFVLISIPITFYLAYDQKHGYLYLILVVFELACIVLTESRASLVVALPGIAIVSTALCFKKKTGRLGYWIAYGIAVAAAIAFCIVFWDKIYDMIKPLFSGGMSDSGRFALWKWGFDGWKDHPIFGGGYKFIEGNPRYRGEYLHSFHCTPLTYLYTAGVIGLAAYIYHRYKTVRLTFSARLTPERVFVALSILAMLFNALLDVAMNSAQHLLFYSIMLALLEHDVKYVKSIAAEEPNREKECAVATSDVGVGGSDNTTEINTEGEI